MPAYNWLLVADPLLSGFGANWHVGFSLTKCSCCNFISMLLPSVVALAVLLDKGFHLNLQVFPPSLLALFTFSFSPITHQTLYDLRYWAENVQFCHRFLSYQSWLFENVLRFSDYLTTSSGRADLSADLTVLHHSALLLRADTVDLLSQYYGPQRSRKVGKNTTSDSFEFN